MIWKSCDIGQSSLEQSERTQGLEGLGRVQKELGLGVTSRDMGSSWCTYSAHMVMEIKEYDVRAHEHGMVVLEQMNGR